MELVAFTLSASFLIVFFLAPNLWFDGQELPTAPVVAGIILPIVLNQILVAGLLLLVVMAVLDKSGWLSLMVAYLLLFLVFYDIQRFQEITLILITGFVLVGLYKRGHILANQTLQCLVLLLFAQSAVGGLMKLNSFYEQNVFSWLTQPLSKWPMYRYYHHLWFVVPMVEIGSVLLLLFKSTRKFGWVIYIAFHLAMFLLMGPVGSNYNRVNWISHFMLPVLVLITTTDSDFIRPYARMKGRPLAWVFIAAFYALPLLRLIGYYDAVPAFASLDGRHQIGYLSFEKYVLPRLPLHLQKRAVKITGHEKYSLQIEEMAWQQKGIVFYHEDRVFKQYKKWLQPYANHPGDVFVILLSKGETTILQ